MEQNPISINETSQAKTQMTKPQIWLLAGAILIGIALELWLEQTYASTYSVLWLVALAVFVIFNFKRVAVYLDGFFR